MPGGTRCNLGEGGGWAALGPVDAAWVQVCLYSGEREAAGQLDLGETEERGLEYTEIHI